MKKLYEKTKTKKQLISSRQNNAKSKVTDKWSRMSLVIPWYIPHLNNTCLPDIHLWNLPIYLVLSYSSIVPSLLFVNKLYGRIITEGINLTWGILKSTLLNGTCKRTDFFIWVSVPSRLTVILFFNIFTYTLKGWQNVVIFWYKVVINTLCHSHHSQKTSINKINAWRTQKVG